MGKISSVVTKHAETRIRKRVGLPRCRVQDHAELVWDKGVRHKDTNGSLNKFITKKFLVNTNANNIKVYGTFIYIFAGKTLATVLDAPPGLRNQSKKATKKKKEKESRWTQKHSTKY